MSESPIPPSFEVIDPPPSSPVPKRNRGAQPGNLNALRHGLYLEGNRIRNTTPLERAELFDIANVINYIKDYIQFTWQAGRSAKELADINETMRSLSLAGLSLARLIAIHDQHISSPLPGNLNLTPRSGISKVVEHYKKQLGSFVDLSGIDTTFFDGNG